MSAPAHAVAPGAEPLVVLRDVRKTFHGRHGGVRAVDGVDLEIERGTTMSLVGESGSGKTTLGRCVLGLVRWESGTIQVAGASLADLRGRALREFRRHAQMVFQDPFGSLNPRMRVGTILEEPLILHGNDDRGTRREKVAAILARVQLDASYGRRFPGELSGGEQQRVGIARAVITEPRLIVLDEPTAALDAPVRKGIFELLSELQRTMGLTYLLISHDLASVWGVSDAVAVMHRGRIVESGSRDDVFLSPRHPYTVALMSAAPYVAHARHEHGRRLVLQGDEDLAAEDICRFAGRCPLAVERCGAERPPLEAAGGRHAVACWRADEVPVELGAFRARWHALHAEASEPDPMHVLTRPARGARALTTSARPRDGVVIERPDLLLLDSREMKWEDFDGLASAKVKVLAHDEHGNASVMIVWMPPGELPGVALPHRHYHRTITEFTYVLGGDLPHWEYADASQQQGDLVVFREGYFMERLPGSIHGLEAGRTSATGCVLLMWRDGVGNWLNEPEAAEETIDVAYDAGVEAAPDPRELHADADGVVLARPDVTILDTRAMPWLPFAGLAGAKVKVLARDANGDDRVTMVHMPPGLRPGARRHRHFHRTVREFALVLAGELPHWEYEDAAQAEGELVRFREGFFMDRRPGSIHGNECTVTSSTGCVLLFWRDGTGNWLDEPNAPQETVEVPYPAA